MIEVLAVTALLAGIWAIIVNGHQDRRQDELDEMIEVLGREIWRGDYPQKRKEIRESVKW